MPTSSRIKGVFQTIVTVAAFGAAVYVCAPVLRHVVARDVDQGSIGVLSVLLISVVGVLAFLQLFRLGVTWRGADFSAIRTLSGMNPVLNGGMLLCVAGLITLGHSATHWPPSNLEAASEALASLAMIVFGETLLAHEAPHR